MGQQEARHLETDKREGHQHEPDDQLAASPSRRPVPSPVVDLPTDSVAFVFPIVVLLQVTCAAGAECRLALATRCQTKVRACVLHRFFYRVFHASSRTRVRGSPPPAAGSERATLFGISEGGPMCLLFAATYPSSEGGPPTRGPLRARHSRLHPAFAQFVPQPCRFRLLAPDEIAGQVGDHCAVHAAWHLILDVALRDR